MIDFEISNLAREWTKVAVDTSNFLIQATRTLAKVETFIEQKIEYNEEGEPK